MTEDQIIYNDQVIVRDLTHNDIDLIADYWLKSDHEFLESMGVDISKLPSREKLTLMLEHQIQSKDHEKRSLAFILEVDGVAVGHCNVNAIEFGKEATMHLHLWQHSQRRKGLGSLMVQQSVPRFFERLKLNVLWCEPYALNPAPNKTLQKLGFELVRTYETIPGSLNFKQLVNRYQLTKAHMEKSVRISEK